MNCIAVDDESPALFLIEDNIKRIPFLKLVKTCKNAFEAIEILQKEKIDLVFLDIEMPGLNGLDFLKTIPSKPLIILTTAYKQYALDGYSFDIIDYLLKPFPFDRFLKAVNKAYEYHGLKQKGQTEPLLQSAEDIFVYSEYNLVKVPLNQITHIEALKDYVKIFLLDATRPILTKATLKSMEEKLPSSKFIRVHKSFIIAKDHIKSIRKNIIFLGKHQVPFSESYRESIFSWINMG